MKTIHVLCNAGFLNLAGTIDVTPIKCSAPLRWFSECIFAAEFYEEHLNLERLSELKCDKARAWWREIGSSNVDWCEHPWQPRKARKDGLFNWICDTFGASQPKNVAAIIGDISQIEMKTPVKLFNSFNR